MRLYLDSSAIIYARESSPAARAQVIERVLAACFSPDGVVITSTLARLECRVRPLRERDTGLLAEYDAIFKRFDLVVLDITRDVIERATLLRATHGFKTPDAIHLATAFVAHADVFLTGDAALQRCPGIHIEIVKPI